MNRLVITLPLPSKACAQNSHVGYHERARHTKHDRILAAEAAKLAMLGTGWKAGPTIVEVEYNIVLWRSRHIALGRTKAEASRRAAMMRQSRKYPAYAPQDPQNAVGAAKAYIDGLVDAGVLEADDYGHVLSFTGSVVCDPTRDPGVTITLTKAVGK